MADEESRFSTSLFDVTDLTNKREVGSDPGTLWSLSSEKPGHGVRQLRDDDLERLWQSDGIQPHRISIEFASRTDVTHVSLWLNVKRDDSYTPTKVLIKAGTGWQDLTEVRYREWEGQSDEPFGWKHFLLSTSTPRSKKSEEKDLLAQGTASLQPISVWVLQISILANQQNGKDTHIRSCLVWGPKSDDQRELDAVPAPTEGVTSRRDDQHEEDDEEDESDNDDSWVDLGRTSNNPEVASLWRSLR